MISRVLTPKEISPIAQSWFSLWSMLPHTFRCEHMQVYYIRRKESHQVWLKHVNCKIVFLLEHFHVVSRCEFPPPTPGIINELRHKKLFFFFLSVSLDKSRNPYDYYTQADDHNACKQRATRWSRMVHVNILDFTYKRLNVRKVKQFLKIFNLTFR